MIYNRYVINGGDTLQSISQNVLGDATKWYDLAEYNNLVYPYISNTSSERVYGPGDTLIIPDANNQNYDITLDKLSYEQKHDLEAFVMGKDLSLMGDTSAIETRGSTDELVSLSSDGKKIAKVVGYDNLVQALLMRLNTPLGSLILHPDYGSNFYSLLGENNTTSNVNKIMVGVEQTIRKDSRVSNVTVEAVRVDPTQISIKATITPVGLEKDLDLFLGATKTGIRLVG